MALIQTKINNNNDMNKKFKHMSSKKQKSL